MKSGETFRDVDNASDPAVFVEFLEAAARLPGVAEIKEMSFRELRLSANQSLLDVGTGLGDDLCRAAELVGLSGRVVGLDRSKVLLAHARQRCSFAAIELCEGDAGALPFGAETFDACRADRILLHVEQPATVIAEMVRVLRPGGRLAVFDLDWATLLVDHPNRELTELILSAICNRHRYPWLGRTLGRFLHVAGMCDVRTQPAVISLDRLFFRRLCRHTTTDVVENGGASANAVAAWLRDLDELADAGRFVACITGYLASGSKSRDETAQSRMAR